MEAHEVLSDSYVRNHTKMKNKKTKNNKTKKKKTPS